MLLLSQPTRSSGFFYDTHNRLAAHNGGIWNSIRMDSRASPLVSDEFIAEKEQEYTLEEFTIKVVGEFPDSRDGYLLGRKAAEACFERENVIQAEASYGLMLSCDVGAGEYRDKSVAVAARVSGYGDFGADARRVEVFAVPVLSNTKNLHDFSGLVFNIAAEMENVTTFVDAGGMGIAVCQQLETLGLPEVKRVKWGSPCFLKRNRERFFNLRAQAMVTASRAALEGRLSIANGVWKKELLDQMSRVPYHFDDKARYVIERKDEMRKQGIPSPDLWDAICFLFLEDAHYMLCEGSAAAKTSVATIIAKAEDMFSDV
jgi:hypothetical protein